ncbi:uncharacterized protein LOC111026913 [Myzus persicae]|uniref:uncharacterized protein LOC111026913 n=1 Tax=Myzus persicae TaxID=13164 RepID=UPI000B936D49|nr:uncharacterized protein LOC111026913 [Myzus persicae]
MDNRSNSAFPQPKLPASFVDLLPINSNETLYAVESLLQVEGCIKNKEELKTFLLLKIGNRHNSLNSAVTAIFDLCFERSYASIFSFHGKTKKSFKTLGIFQVMQDTLSGRVNSPQDTDTITKVIINILKHAKK